MTEENQKIFRIGPIRPPSEANSLLLQVTEGCTWNRCKFCQLYRHTHFRVYSTESVKADIDLMAEYAEKVKRHLQPTGNWDYRGVEEEMSLMAPAEQECYYLIFNWLVHGGQNVFLQDGNTLAVKPERVLEILLYLREKFPNVKRVTTYGRAETLSKISVDDYRRLKNAGLDRIHSGFESGSDQVLQKINKGVTSEQEILAGKNIRDGGIELSVYFMPGIGGRRLSRENAIETARVVRAINPDFVRIRTAVIKRGTELWEEYQNGNFQLCSENEILQEIRILIENTKGCTGTLTSDHIINLLQGVHGKLDADREKMLGTIDDYFAMPEIEQKMYQLARRSGLVSYPRYMKRLPQNRIAQLRSISESITDDEEWIRKLNGTMMGFI